MSDVDKALLDRIAARVSASSHDDDVSEDPELMLAIHTEDGVVYLAPYHDVRGACLLPENRMAEDARPAEVVVEFAAAVVKFRGDGLEVALRLLQQHRIRRLRSSKRAVSAHGFSVRDVRYSPTKATA